MRALNYVAVTLLFAGGFALFAGCSSEPGIQPDPSITPPIEPQGGTPGSPCTGSNGEAGHLAADNTCCTEGCLDAQNACHPVTRIDSLDYSTDPGMCGHHGNACKSCDDGNPCTDDVCAEVGCAHYKWDHTKACTVGNASGFCDMPSGKCCTDNNSVSCCQGCVLMDYTQSTPKPIKCVSQCPGGQVCNPRTTQCVPM